VVAAAGRVGIIQPGVLQHLVAVAAGRVGIVQPGVLQRLVVEAAAAGKVGVGMATAVPGCAAGDNIH
jgi:hypothetical protein